MKIKLLFCVLALSVLGFGQAAITVTNAGTTGTTVNSLAKINTSNNAVITGTSDTTVPAYIVTGGAGTSGLAVLGVAGQANCTMDSTIASSAGGFYVIASVTVGGDCHAQSAAPALGVWVVGYLASSSTTSGSTAAVTVINGWFAGAGIALSQLASQSANTGAANTTSGSAAPAAYSIPSGIQNYVAGTGYNQATAHQTEAPALCSDSSGSGTAQTCTFAPALTPAANDCMTYTTTTTNSGAGLTIAAGGLAAKSVAIPGASGWTTTLTASIIPANKPLQACYDGTNWNVTQTGTAAAGSSGGSITGSGLTTGNAYYNIGGTLTPANAYGIPTALTVTFTNSSAVITATNTMIVGAAVQFQTTGGLPTNFSTATTYYVISTGLSTSQFEVSATYGGSAVTAGSAGSGTQTATINPGLVTNPAYCVASSSTVCVFSGPVTGLSGFTAGQAVYVSDATSGALTNTNPSSVAGSSGHFVQRVGVATSTTAILVTISPDVATVQ